MSQNSDQQNHFPKKIGNTMIVIAWIIFLGILTLFDTHGLDLVVDEAHSSLICLKKYI